MTANVETAARTNAFSVRYRTKLRKLGLAALANAVHRRQPPSGVLHHGNRDSQYVSAAYQALLATAQTPLTYEQEYAASHAK